MTREEKNQIIDALVVDLNQYGNFYITDISALTVEKTNQLRRACVNKNIKLSVAKNTLIRK
ncbi:MAG: 50S ribosomal protein L10, partial [Bacteroidota bacterium]